MSQEKICENCKYWFVYDKGYYEGYWSCGMSIEDDEKSYSRWKINKRKKFGCIYWRTK
jgi:hypothetical protein